MTVKQFLLQSQTHHWIYLCALVGLTAASGQADDSSGMVSSANSASSFHEGSPKRTDWRRHMSKKALPKPGCFKATHPSSTWEEIPCGTPPNTANAPSKRLANSTSGTSTGPSQVGGGIQGVIASSSQPISWAEGTFPRVTGVTSGITGYALQLNTQPGPAGIGLCSGAQTQSNCQPWQQFMFQNPWVYIQYWLTSYANTCTVNYGTCGSSPCSNGCYMCPQGWSADNATNPGCYFNGNGFNVSQIEGQPLTDLANLALIAHTTSTSQQTFLMTGNGALYSSQDSGDPLNVSQWWTQAEFNVFGWSNLAKVDLGPNAVVTVQLITDTVPASTPSASQTWGFTAESNNMFILPNSWCAFGGSQPGIQFTEGYIGAPSPACPLPIQEDPVAFQANDNFLYLYNNGQTTNTWLGMYSGTIPSEVMSPNGPLPKIAFQANNQHLYLVDLNGGQPADTGKLMRAGTSPSVTLLADQYPTSNIIVAYQGSDGYLHLFRSDAWTDTRINAKMTGSPSISLVENQSSYGHYAVAFRSSPDNYCYTYDVALSFFSKCNASEPVMMAGTSPSIAAVPVNANVWTTVFQGTDGILYWYTPSGGGNTGLAMMPGTSPSVTVLHDGSYAIAFQAGNGYLHTFVEGINTNTYTKGFPQMAAHASPIIMPTSKFGYQVAFEASSTNLYIDDNGTAINTQLGMNTP